MVGPLPESQEYDSIIVMVGTRTKAVKFEAANPEIMGEGTGHILKTQVFWDEGLPRKIYSDRGPQFISSAMKKLYDSLGIEGNPSTSYHPQTDGQTERINQELGCYLRAFVNDEQEDWVEWLPITEFAYNNAINEVTGETPFFLKHGP
jgi:transposase InsO family protein